MDNHKSKTQTVEFYAVDRNWHKSVQPLHLLGYATYINIIWQVHPENPWQSFFSEVITEDLCYAEWGFLIISND